MAEIQLSCESLNAPNWLPDPSDIVEKRTQHGYGPSRFVEYSPDFLESLWIKYGPRISMGEARTQAFIADAAIAKDFAARVPRIFYAFRHQKIGYIVMQHIRGRTCTLEDLPQIIRAVEQFRTIESPTTSPGPIGGGPIGHHLFNDGRSSVRYTSVEELQAHIHNTLSFAGYPSTCMVDFSQEDGGPLKLCFDDLHLGNFLKDEDGQLYVLDFGKTNFLPSAFQDLTFADGRGLARDIAVALGHSISRNRGGMMLAAARFDLFQNNDLNLPTHLRRSDRSNLLE